jgi:phosphate transport system permease protein
MHAPLNPFKARTSASRTIERGAFWFFRLATYFILVCATFIFAKIAYEGAGTVFKKAPPFVNWTFLSQPPETLYVFDVDGKKTEMGDAEFRAYKKARGVEDIPAENYVYCAGGIGPCIVGTVLLIIGSMFIALLLGVFSAIYLSEYSKSGRWVKFIRLAILNLAGVPSIVFGLFGFGLFVIFMPLIQGAPNPDVLHFQLWPLHCYLNFSGWNVCLLSGWFTLAFMALPVVIAASEESLKSVPQGFREGSLALGATKWQSIRTNVLPYALPGILTSSVLGIARVAGETAPIMFTAAYVVRNEMPWEGMQWLHPATWGGFFFQGVMALPYHIYVVSSKIPQNEYTARVQYGTAFVFLFIVSLLALSSIILRIKVRSRYKW